MKVIRGNVCKYAAEQSFICYNNIKLKENGFDLYQLTMLYYSNSEKFFSEVKKIGRKQQMKEKYRYTIALCETSFDKLSYRFNKYRLYNYYDLYKQIDLYKDMKRIKKDNEKIVVLKVYYK